MKTTTRALAALLLAATFFPLAAPARAESAIMTADRQERATKLIGAPVYNAQNEQIGTLDDILIPASGGAASAVVSVGGYLGGGDREVVVPLSRVKIQKDAAVMQVTKAQLSAMKPFSFRMAADAS